MKRYFWVLASLLILSYSGFAFAQEAAEASPAKEETVKTAKKTKSGSDLLDEEVEEGGIKSEDQRLTLGDRIKAVQRKVFMKDLRHELFPSFAMSLNDPFHQHLMVGGAYAFHIADAFAVEASFNYVLASPKTDIIRVVRETATAVPEIVKPQYFINLNGHWAPIYGKFSLMSEKIFHYDLYLVGGFAAVKSETGHHIGGTVGIGSRVFVNDWLTVRIELRDTIYNDTFNPANVEEADIQNYLWLSVGASFFLPPSFEYSMR